MNVSPPPANPNSRFRVWTNRRTVDSATTTSGISRRSRTQIRCAVWRCFRGAFRSDCRISSMYPVAGPSFGFSRGAAFRSGGTALAIASRTIRRCTPNFRATPFIVPTPCSYSRRICSNNSTFCLLFNWPPFPTRPGPKQNIRIYVLNRGAKSEYQSGPIQSSEITGLAIADEAGRRYLIGVAAAVQYAVFPVWFGIALVLGFPERGITGQRLLTLAINLVTIAGVAALAYAALGMRRSEVQRFVKSRFW